MNLHYRWTLKDAIFTKDKGTVFSCFACGGGSTMGYKLAGFDVIGCNEIDKRMMAAYIANHNPKYSYLEPIQSFKLRNDLPDELYNLDILDGSPPCSSFSISGNRSDDWGKKKKFREGQASQVLDTLFFDFIYLAKKLQPKVVIAENVKGLLLGEAIQYVRKIYIEFERAGYVVQHFLLDASTMGVPQKRERVFFIALRKDLTNPFMERVDLFTSLPRLEMKFKEKEIPFEEIEDLTDMHEYECNAVQYWKLCKPGDSFANHHPKGHFFNWTKVDPKKPIGTISGDHGRAGAWHYKIQRPINNNEIISGGSFPHDYNFIACKPAYIIGMSVPPIMTARIANEIYIQWLSKINQHEKVN